MAWTVSAADANRRFSEILGRAANGETVIITRRGEPVAQLAPYGAGHGSDARDRAFDRLLATLEEGLPLGGGAFNRDELYEDR